MTASKERPVEEASSPTGAIPSVREVVFSQGSGCRYDSIEEAPDCVISEGVAPPPSHGVVHVLPALHDGAVGPFSLSGSCAGCPP